MCLLASKKQKCTELAKKKVFHLSASRIALCLFLCFVLCVESSSARCPRVRAKEMLCGAELVDILQFVCGPTGFYFSKAVSQRNRNRPGIVEECCFCGCNMNILESYCAAPITNTTGREDQRT
ncbi:insulin-like growth factor III [Pelobates fuscus]|uniref:insulin-like growth factor III n=1 Tax=Pelobates fuscus TaxID=191477 RepID=UPI002FE4600E